MWSLESTPIFSKLGWTTQATSFKLWALAKLIPMVGWRFGPKDIWAYKGSTPTTCPPPMRRCCHTSTMSCSMTPPGALMEMWRMKMMRFTCTEHWTWWEAGRNIARCSRTRVSIIFIQGPGGMEDLWLGRCQGVFGGHKYWSSPGPFFKGFNFEIFWGWYWEQIQSSLQAGKKWTPPGPHGKSTSLMSK